MVYVRVQTTTVTAGVQRFFMCKKCGFDSPVVVEARGQGQSLSDFQGRPLADQRAKLALEQDTQCMLDMVPCPQCGARKNVATHHRRALVLSLLTVPLIIGGSLLLAALLMPARSISLQIGLCVWAGFSLVAGGAMYLRHFADRRRAPDAVQFLPLEKA